MYNRVLMVIHGAKTSLKAAEYVVELKKRHPEAEVEIIGVATSPVDRNALIPGLLDIPMNFGIDTRMQTEARIQARQELGRTKALFDQVGLDVSPVLLEGDPGKNIVSYANRRGADHIVIGSGEPGFWGGVLRGSVAEQVVEGANCPVTVIT